MDKKSRKFRKNKFGFTLVEVMIGMMILTVAIVSATNLLIGLMKSNKTVVDYQKAYYLAQEGIEGVRNIRDSNWMHNVNWLGDEEMFGVMVAGKVYSLSRDENTWGSPNALNVDNKSDLRLPWKFSLYADMTAPPDFYNNVLKVEVGGPVDFYRHINILGYPVGCENDGSCKDDFILVQSVVNFRDIGREQEVFLEEVMTDWKGGAL